MSSREKRRTSSREGNQRVGLRGDKRVTTAAESRESALVGRAGWCRGAGHRGHLGR